MQRSSICSLFLSGHQNMDQNLDPHYGFSQANTGASHGMSLLPSPISSLPRPQSISRSDIILGPARKKRRLEFVKCYFCRRDKQKVNVALASGCLLRSFTYTLLHRSACPRQINLQIDALGANRKTCHARSVLKNVESGCRQ